MLGKLLLGGTGWEAEEYESDPRKESGKEEVTVTEEELQITAAF